MRSVVCVTKLICDGSGSMTTSLYLGLKEKRSDGRTKGI